MKYLSLFSGYGGFELGIQQAYENKNKQWPVQTSHTRRDLSDSDSGLGGEQEQRSICIGFSEIDKYATQIYKKHFNHKEYGDITKLNPKEIEEFDLLVGGFPCQAFSIAGKRAGFEDTRGTLIYDVFRIIKEKHPKLVLLENVKGLLSHDNGRTFKTIITSLAELGYAVEWQVLNAKNFGVPQNRERVFIIGHLGGFGGRQVFPITNDTGEIIKEHKRKRITTGRTRNFGSSAQLHQPDEICSTMTRSMETGGNNVPCIANTLDANYWKGNSATKERHTPRTEITDGMKIRRLTPTECERLMGLPDGWTEGVSDTQRYKLCGNGVVVNVVKEIIKRLI